MDIVPKGMPLIAPQPDSPRSDVLQRSLTFPFAVPMGRAITAPQKCFTQKIPGARCALLLLLCADRPKRLFDAAGFGILHQRHPGCFATLRARKLLHRYHGALDRSAKKADDDQNMDHDVFSIVECGAAGR